MKTKQNNHTTETQASNTQAVVNDALEKIKAYPLEVSSLQEDDGGGFQALYPILARSIVGYGDTYQEAIADLEGLIPSFLDYLQRTAQTLPDVPVEKDWEAYSGKFNVRLPRALHAQLVTLAEEQGVSLNSLVQTMLATGTALLSAGNLFGAVQQVPIKMQLRQN